MESRCSILAGKFHGQRSLTGYSPRGHKELDTTERLNTYTYAFKKEKKKPLGIPARRKILGREYLKQRKR